MARAEQVDAIDEQLIELLGETDALFEPIRDWTDNRHASAVLERQAAFQRHGLPYAAGGSGAERVAATRAADDLEASGRVEFFRTNSKRTGWRLSDAEDWRLRWWCLLPGESDAQMALTAIRAHAKFRHTYDQEKSGMVPELVLSGGGWGDGQGQRLIHLENVLLPSLIRGWATATSDCQGHIFYGVTKAGETFLDNWDGPTFKPHQYSTTRAQKMSGAYDAARTVARDLLKTIRAESNRVAIPLSAGCHPETKCRFKPIIDERGNVQPLEKVLPKKPARSRRRKQRSK